MHIGIGSRVGEKPRKQTGMRLGYGSRSTEMASRKAVKWRLLHTSSVQRQRSTSNNEVQTGETANSSWSDKGEPVSEFFKGIIAVALRPISSLSPTSVADE